MDFDLGWWLLVIAATFALGWLASRLDLRQAKRDPRDASQPYFKGLNLLLNEQQDKAIDAFIEAVQHDPDTAELHFALGNLFRRRGETERAVRVHEHLLNRGDLPASERARAQHALAQDFFKAGLFDRAEAAYLALKGSAYELEAELALLSLYERSRDWARAFDVAQALEARGTGSFAPRRAQYLCELALAARAQGAQEQAAQLLAQAQSLAPGHARARVLAGQWALAAGDAGASLQAFEGLLLVNPGAFNLIASDYAKAAEAAGQSERALQQLADRHVAAPSLALLTAMQLLDAGGHGARLQTYVQQHPSLNAARSLLQPLLNQHAPDAAPALLRAIDNAAKPLLRHRCAACGFEATHYFWQCPGCLSWDSFPPRPVEEL
jgi:lipopolysaccharide biosynthesis regulator YciM